MRRLAVLGSTGSIGQQTLDVVGRFPDRYRVVALAAASIPLPGLRLPTTAYGVTATAIGWTTNQTTVNAAANGAINRCAKLT